LQRDFKLVSQYKALSGKSPKRTVAPERFVFLHTLAFVDALQTGTFDRALLVTYAESFACPLKFIAPVIGRCLCGGGKMRRSLAGISENTEGKDNRNKVRHRQYFPLFALFRKTPPEYGGVSMMMIL